MWHGQAGPGLAGHGKANVYFSIYSNMGADISTPLLGLL